MIQYHLLSTFLIPAVFYFGCVQAKPQLRLRLQQQKLRLNPAVIADVAGDMQDAAPDVSIQNLDKANQELQAEDQAPPKFNDSYVPRSPPHGPDVSPGDLHEKIDDTMGAHSDFWRPEPPGMPLGFKASTCATACSACRSSADESLGCKCMATCIEGADSSKCLHKPIGWSNNLEQTQAIEIWEGKCNNGITDCSECIDEEMQKRSDSCKGDPVCLHKLRKAMAKSAPEHFCLNTKTPLSTCERFTHVPKENDWKCYLTLEECDISHDRKPYEETFGSLTTPCVWCTVSNTDDAEDENS